MSNPVTLASESYLPRFGLTAFRHGQKEVIATVLAGQDSVARNATTAVVTRGQIPAFLASLPPHRTFSSDRRRQILDQIRTALG